MAIDKHNCSGTHGVPPARSFMRVQTLLIAIEKLERPSLQALTEHTGIPERSIHSLLAKMNKEFFVFIERVNGRRHGYYRVVDWGALNRDRILALAEPKKGNSVDEEQVEIDFHQN